MRPARAARAFAALRDELRATRAAYDLLLDRVIGLELQVAALSPLAPPPTPLGLVALERVSVSPMDGRSEPPEEP
jgi:hypothetical protein